MSTPTKIGILLPLLPLVAACGPESSAEVEPVVEERVVPVRTLELVPETVTDVAVWFGVTRQTVHRWLRKYAAEGIAGLGRRGRCRVRIRCHPSSRLGSWSSGVSIPR